MSQRRNRSLQEFDANAPGVREAIEECVRYIFYREGSKIPIKRAEIIKHLASTCQTSPNQVNTFISEANKLLKKV